MSYYNSSNNNHNSNDNNNNNNNTEEYSINAENYFALEYSLFCGSATEKLYQLVHLAKNFQKINLAVAG